MPFIKTVAVALITAMASPFCCCLADLAIDAEVISTNQTPVDHACCSASKGDESQQQSSEEHTPSDCPHQIEKDSQIRQTDSVDLLAKANFFVATSLPAINFDSNLKAASKTAVSTHAKNVLPHSIKVGQVYCVYLL